jgi:Skp family chaperone for outer membrane proteins
MSVRNWTLALSLGLGCLAGCEKGPAPVAAPPQAKPIGGVAVVDLDSVAKQLGRDVEMNKAVEERLNVLNDKLGSLRKSLDLVVDEKRNDFGNEPNEEQQKLLTAIQERNGMQLLNSQREYQRDLALYKQQLIDQFREQAKPVLREVAAARGLSIVIPKNAGLLLTIDPATEITDEVAQKMLASQGPPADSRPEKKSKRKAAAETSAR